jgi:hypothetical protein
VTRTARHLAPALACALALLAIAGCSSSDQPKGEKLPRATVAELNQRLGEIERRYADGTENNNVGACNDIQNDSLQAVNTLISGLPDDTDADIRSALNDSFRRLQELTQDGCAQVEKPQTDTETTPQETVTEQTPTTDTTPTETTPTETTPTQTTPGGAKQKPPKQNGGGGTKPDTGGGGTEAPQGGQ